LTADQPGDLSLARHPDADTGTPDASADYRPAPFREFVVKVATRCDLSCTYCYMYLPGNESWKSLPRVMSRPVADRIGRSIGTHVRQHGLDEIAIVLHGGEPMLAGADRLVDIAGRLRGHVPPATRVRISLQTNGMLLDEDAPR
jgi:uncharacterized protein